MFGCNAHAEREGASERKPHAESTLRDVFLPCPFGGRLLRTPPRGGVLRVTPSVSLLLYRFYHGACCLTREADIYIHIKLLS